MRLIPNSYGAKVREFNPCHDPKSGQFSAKGQGNCDPGELTDKGRQRAIYGQQYAGDDLEQRLDLSQAQEEADALTNHIGSNDDDDAIKEAKDDVTRALAQRLTREKVPGVDALYSELSGSIDEFYEEISGAKEEEEHTDEYDEYKSEAIAEEEQALREEADKSFREAREEYAGSVIKAMDALKKAYEGAEFPHGHPMEIQLRQRTLDLDVDVELRDRDPEAFLRNNKLFDEFYSDDGWDMDGLTKALASEEGQALIASQLERTTMDFSVYDRANEVQLDYLTRSEYEAVMGDSRYFATHPDDVDYYNDRGFDRYASDEGLSLEVTGENIDDYETWAEKNGYGSGGDNLNYTDTQKVASFLVHKWANTSGDADPVSLAMQFAINDEFKLGATYTGHYIQRDEAATAGQRRGEPHAITSARKLYETHGEVLRGFARQMYNNTQYELESAGIPEYVTVLRGFSIGRREERTINSVDVVRGEAIDLLLQPASSFTSDGRTAVGFGGSFNLNRNGLIIAMRVPRSQILSTPRTGYGALNESEVVVLGGRYPGFVMDSQEAAKVTSGGDTLRYGAGALPKLMGVSKRYRQRRRREQTIVGPGDAV